MVQNNKDNKRLIKVLKFKRKVTMGGLVLKLKLFQCQVHKKFDTKIIKSFYPSQMIKVGIVKNIISKNRKSTLISIKIGKNLMILMQMSIKLQIWNKYIMMAKKKFFKTVDQVGQVVKGAGNMVFAGPKNIIQGVTDGVKGLGSLSSGNFWQATKQFGSAAKNLSMGSIGLIGTGAGLYALKKGRQAYHRIKNHGVKNTALDLIQKGGDIAQQKFNIAGNKISDVTRRQIIQRGKRMGQLYANNLGQRVSNGLQNYQDKFTKYYQSKKPVQVQNVIINEQYTPKPGALLPVDSVGSMPKHVSQIHNKQQTVNYPQI